ncbi:MULTISPECIES: MltR family transcriptional regulator [Pseudomonadaceae]|uniref:MltR family transcriptional regulator n=1 Tax=Pseudomonadaceae TaxID=135621 RepID=UPI001C92F7E9|nr:MULTISPECIES: MltR family transcriptional regulator [Pseudomonas]MCP1620151.1 DNA-binding MltR family transcriptional regulator [Pseudomonas otitidis]
MHNKNLNKEHQFSEFNQLYQYLNKLDERGIVLSVSAFTEESLGRLIKAYFRPVKSTSDLLDGFNAPLGTFSSRIKISHSVGLLQDQQFSDLERLRKIRNHFAHTWKKLEFEDKKISEHIKELSYSRITEEFPETLRDKFISSMTSMIIELECAKQEIERSRKTLKITTSNLIAGFAGDYKNQIESARKELKETLKQLPNENKEKEKFYITALNRLSERVKYINWNTESEREEIIELHLQIKTFLHSLAIEKT